MSAPEYGCNYCRITFTKPDSDKLKGKDKVKCPRCGSGDVEKFVSPADKFRFFTRFAFGGG
jgi:DNA-directed RNA polymerase subunit RPC12/RpoP